MAKGDWWFKFEIQPWRSSPELRRCSLATRGFWIDCIAIMRDLGKATITGSIEEFAKMIGCLPAEARACINELKRYKTADVTLGNKFVTLRSRKYAKELKAKELTRLRVAKHREKKDVTPNVTDRVISKELEVRKEEEKQAPTELTKRPPRQQPKLTRIPNPFPITPEMYAWLAENIPDLEDLNSKHADFVEYWTNAPPGKAEKIDWNLTWQKGMRMRRKWQEDDKRNGTNSSRTGPDRRTDAEILRDSADQIASKYSN